MVDLDAQRSLAARVAACADLVEIRTFGVEAGLDKLPSQPGGLSYAFDANIEVQFIEETSTLIVDGSYELTLTEGSDEDTTEGDQDVEKRQVAHLNFQMASLYAVSEPNVEHGPFADDELDAFGKTTGQLALYPYAREFVADLTGRMGLPTLHLGPLQLFLDKRNDEMSADT